MYSSFIKSIEFIVVVWITTLDLKNMCSIQWFCDGFVTNGMCPGVCQHSLKFARQGENIDQRIRIQKGLNKIKSRHKDEDDQKPEQISGKLSASEINRFRKLLSKSMGMHDEDSYSTDFCWAYEIKEIERGSVLLSTSQDKRYKNVVILILDHCDVEGSKGIILNHAESLIHINDLLGLDPEIRRKCGSNPLYFGGPVDPFVLTALHFIDAEEADKLAPGLFISYPPAAAWHGPSACFSPSSIWYGSDQSEAINFNTMPALCEALEQGTIQKDNIWIGRGMTVWPPGELQAQFDQGMWLLRAASPKVLLSCASDASVLWRKVYNLSQIRDSRRDMYE